MSSPRVIYSPRPDATPEAEVSALAGVYRFILEESCYAKKEAVGVPSGDDEKPGFGGTGEPQTNRGGGDVEID